jgi:hypothetical protein
VKKFQARFDKFKVWKERDLESLNSNITNNLLSNMGGDFRHVGKNTPPKACIEKKKKKKKKVDKENSDYENDEDSGDDSYEFDNQQNQLAEHDQEMADVLYAEEDNDPITYDVVNLLYASNATGNVYFNVYLNDMLT